MTSRVVPVAFALVVVLAAIAVVPGAVAGGGAADVETDTAGKAVEQRQQNITSVAISELTVSGVSGTFTVPEATITITQDGATTTREVQNLQLDLEDAGLQLENATLTGDGLRVDSASLTVTSGTITASSPDIDAAIEDVNLSGEDRTVTIEDLPPLGGDLLETLEGATIETLTVSDVSAELSIDNSLGVVEITDGEESQFTTLALGGVVLSFDRMDVTIENATVEDGAIMLGSAETRVDRAEIYVDRVFVLRGDRVTERFGITVVRQDLSLTIADQEVEISLLQALLQQLLEAVMEMGSANIR